MQGLLLVFKVCETEYFTISEELVRVCLRVGERERNNERNKLRGKKTQE